MHGHTERTTNNGTDDSHRHCLKQINADRGPTGCAETSQHCGGASLLLKVRVNCARNSDRAKEKRDEANQIEKPVKIIERFAEVLLPLRHRVVFEPGLLDSRRESLSLPPSRPRKTQTSRTRGSAQHSPAGAASFRQGPAEANKPAERNLRPAMLPRHFR